MKCLKSFLLIFLLPLLFINCNNNDKDLYDEDNDFKPTPSVKKRLKSVEGFYKREFKYSNSDGKINCEDYLPFNDYDNDKVYNLYTYNDSFIEETYYGGKYQADGPWKRKFILKDGLITEFNSYSDNEKQKHTFEYEDGKLIKHTGPGATFYYTWEDDVIVKLRVVDSGRTFRNYGFSYSDKLDYGGINAFLREHYTIFYDLPLPLVMQGYFGKIPKYLVSKYECYNDDYYTHDIEYEFDKDGYPVYMNCATMKYPIHEEFFFKWEL